MILDTNALSAMADGDSQLQPILSNASEIIVPVIVLGEFRYGIAHSRNRRRYEVWLAELVAACITVSIDAETAKEYALIRSELKRAGHPLRPTTFGLVQLLDNTPSPY